MSNHNDSVAYDPLPLTSDDAHSDTLYNAPASSDPRLSTYHTPQMVPSELGADDTVIPPGAAQPRFLGAALYDGPGSRSFRDSIASSQHTSPASEYNSSVYALNEPSGAGRFDGSYRDDPRDSYYTGEQGGVPMNAMPSRGNRTMEEKRAAYAPPRAKSRRKLMICAVIACICLLIAAVIIPVYFFVLKPSSSNKNNQNDSSSSNDSSKTGSASPSKPSASAVAVTGGDGTLITMEDGTTFTYKNPFGGYWYWDENDPFNNGAKAQSWTPALNETFQYGVDKIRGVNFGGWLNTEPFISPALYEKYLNNTTPAVDEWTLSLAMAADTAGGGIGQLETHYKTFITEQDFAQVAAAGLNFIRIPLGYWAIEVRDNEPFLPRVSWTYFLKAIKWARKYGLRINLDFHAVPGSQNGWNHSGRLGTIGWLNGPMGYANAQRSLDYIRIIAEFISQPQYKDVVAIFGIINEPQGSTIGQEQLSAFYYEAYQIIRTAGGTGAGNGPYISMHDGFFPRSSWNSYFPNADRMTIDTHPYLCFGGQSPAPMSSYATTPCSSWGGLVNASSASFGLTNAGEFSNAVTDCGLWLNGVNLGTRYEGTYTAGTWPSQGSCTPWTDWQNYTPDTKAAIMQFALASMDALQDYFFWTWKIGNSSVTGTVESPAWSYQLGLENGWMPTDPRAAIGTCGNTNPWTPPLTPAQTGGAGAGNIPASAVANLAWPPASLSTGGPVSSLPSYTPTGTLVTLPVPTFTSTSGSAINAGSGWTNSGDTALMNVPIQGCTYPDPWVDPSSAVPPTCAAPARRSIITPTPSS